jgi:hypothetical protein
MPTPPSKPTDPKVVAAAEETAWQHLMRLTVDATSWSDQGMGPTHSAKSRRKHAEAFIRNALEPDADDRVKKIAQTIALPILMQETTSRGRPPDARRNDILVTAVELVCRTHDLDPTRSAAGAESGCSVVSGTLAKFLDWLPTYCEEESRALQAWAKANPDPQTELRVRTLREHLAALPTRVRKLFPKGPLNEEGIKTLIHRRRKTPILRQRARKRRRH